MATLDEHEDVLVIDMIENTDKGILYKLCVTEFRGKNYLSIREWFLDFEGDYAPTRNGFTIPYTLDNTQAVYTALVKLLSKAEVLNTLDLHNK